MDDQMIIAAEAERTRSQLRMVAKERDEAMTAFGRATYEQFPMHSDHSETLYHYSDIEGFRSIVSENTFWASNFIYLNDSQEIALGNDIMGKLFETLIKQAETTYVEDILKSFRGALWSIYSQAFGVCLSSAKDSLGQWRGYGQGVAIGLDRMALQTKKIFKGVRLEKVIYDSRVAEDIFRAIISHYLDATLNSSQQATDGFVEAMALNFAIDASLYVPIVKDAAFRDEQEWRLILFKTYYSDPNAEPEVKFRTRGDMLLPYMSIKPDPEVAPRLPITEVHIGPRDHMDEHLKYSVEWFMRKHGHEKATVWPSKIPFRPSSAR